MYEHLLLEGRGREEWFADGLVVARSLPSVPHNVTCIYCIIAAPSQGGPSWLFRAAAVSDGVQDAHNRQDGRK